MSGKHRTDLHFCKSVQMWLLIIGVHL